MVRFEHAVTIASCAITAFAQVGNLRERLPTCAISCYANAAVSDDCPPNDMTCHCKADGLWVKTLLSCLPKQCGSIDQGAAFKEGSRLCAGVNQPINFDALQSPAPAKPAPSPIVTPPEGLTTDLGMGNLASIGANHAPVVPVVVPVPAVSAVLIPVISPSPVAVINVGANKASAMFSSLTEATQTTIAASATTATSVSATSSAASDPPAAASPLSSTIQHTEVQGSSLIVLSDPNTATQSSNQAVSPASQGTSLQQPVTGAAKNSTSPAAGSTLPNAATGVRYTSVGASSSGSTLPGGNSVFRPGSSPSSGYKAVGPASYGPSQGGSGAIPNLGYYDADYDDEYGPVGAYPPGYGPASGYGSVGTGVRGSPAVYTGAANARYVSQQVMLIAAAFANLIIFV